MNASRPARTTRLVVVAVSLVHLLGQLVGAGLWCDLTQVLLMPAVAAVLLTHTAEPRSRLVRLTMLALFFSWCGDTLPRFASGDAAFLLMVAGFLAAQLAYCRAFWPYRADSVLVGRRWLLVLAGLAVTGMVALVLTSAPLLAVPVGIYAAALVGMVLLGTGVNRAVGWGAMIGLRAFGDVTWPGDGFSVMLTYIVGQSLITLGVAARDNRARGPLSPRPLR